MNDADEYVVVAVVEVGGKKVGELWAKNQRVGIIRGLGQWAESEVWQKEQNIPIFSICFPFH